MTQRIVTRIVLLLALALVGLAAPALAQGNGNGDGNGRAGAGEDRPQLQRREANDRRDAVPPGWCLGRGNPHNTPENCGDASRARTYAEQHADFHRIE